ncbi:FAD-binding oxidoreductase [Umezawaea sp.]|uniref:FAD-binding oxidoreductase n=1 Tax=Umezawaea sp. TaxID=1955258 RepID=UPI002ED5B575
MDWEHLRPRLRGDLLLPEDGGYDRAKQLQIAEYDAVHPLAIAYCATASDVREAVLFAAGADLHVTVRAGGHNFAGWSTTEGLVLDVSRMDHVGVPSATVRLGPGVRSVEAVTELARHGVQTATGVCPTVCVAGYTTGGGIGWQTRKFGLAGDRLASADLVLADGSLVHCSAEQEPDLFWALRGGGGGNFGVVVGLEVVPTSVPRIVNFTVVWAWDDALDVLDRWQHWMASAPVELSSEIGVVMMDAAPDATPFVMMHGGYFGPRESFDALLEQLCHAAGARPTTVQADDLPYEQAMLRLYRCEDMTPAQRRRVGTTPEALLPRQGFVRERHRMFSAEMSRDAVAAALHVFDDDRRAGQFRYLALTALGGVPNEMPRDATAYVHRDARFLVKYTLIGEDASPGEEELAAAVTWVDRGFAVIDPLSNGHSYVNYPDPALRDWRWSYYGGNYERLVEVKKAYDPEGFFRFPQSIGG